MEVLSVLRQQIWWCYLFLSDIYGDVICSNATVIMMLSGLRRQC